MSCIDGTYDIYVKNNICHYESLFTNVKRKFPDNEVPLVHKLTLIYTTFSEIAKIKQ
jgi:hypothetical protein